MNKRNLVIELMENASRDNKEVHNDALRALNEYNGQIIALLNELTGNDYTDKIKGMSQWTRANIIRAKEYMEEDIQTLGLKGLQCANIVDMVDGKK